MDFSLTINSIEAAKKTTKICTRFYAYWMKHPDDVINYKKDIDEVFISGIAGIIFSEEGFLFLHVYLFFTK